MLDKFKRIREPLTWVVLAGVAAGLVLGVVRLVLLLTWEKVPVFAAFQEIGMSLTNLALVIALIALICACLFMTPATPRATTLARLSAIVVGIGTLLQLVCMILGVAASANAFAVIMEILGGLLDVALKAVAAGVLWILHRGVDAGRLDLAPAPAASALEPAKPTAAPVWQPDKATGTAWRTADEAAAGGVPTALGDQSPQTGSAPRWKPIERSGESDPGESASRG